MYIVVAGHRQDKERNTVITAPPGATSIIWLDLGLGHYGVPWFSAPKGDGGLTPLLAGFNGRPIKTSLAFAAATAEINGLKLTVAS
jgi:hypothetical protein